MKFFLSLLLFISLPSSWAQGQSAQCLALFSQRAPVLLGEGQGGVVHRLFVQGRGFVAQKMYFEKEELESDQRALTELRTLKLPGVRIVRWWNQKELVVDMEYIEGVSLSTVPLSSAFHRKYEQYLAALRDIYAERIRGVKHLDFYQSREDGLWRLNVILRDVDGTTFRVLLRPQNFIVSEGALVLIDPH